MEFDKVKDSGDRTTFSTGSRRDRQAGKGSPHLLPTHALLRLSQHFENGAKKYGERNWEKGQPLSAFLSSAFRHWCELINCDKSEDHGAALMWNAACFIQTVYWIEQGKLPKELDDIGWFKNEDLSNKPVSAGVEDEGCGPVS